MTAARLERNSTLLTLVLTTDSTTTPVIDMRQWTHGRLIIPAGVTTVTLTWYECNTSDGTFVACYDSTPAAVTQTISAEKTYQLPTTLAGAQYLRVTGNAAGTIYLALKA